MADPQQLLDALVAAMLASPKYRAIAPDLIRQIGVQELAKRRTLKEAIKATKDKLHQVGGAFLATETPYARWLAMLQAAHTPAERREACQTIMLGHASMRERLPFLGDFYAAIFADLPPIHSVLDLACGLHPLAFPWLPLAPEATYHAYDIYQDMMAFLGDALPLLGARGQAMTWDVSHATPDEQADLAFLLKAIPCLEQIDKSAGQRLLREIRARYLVVSFPSQSLGGKHKGMAAFYEAHFRDLIADQSWAVRRVLFPTELVFVVDKG
jgi:16S rRNA (guanine(1405)-N(7))-methyltransferase